MDDFRKIFDRIPEQFDRWRGRYCREAFDDLIAYSALELGPGTGQATQPILDTGCEYLAIELGEHLAKRCAANFAAYPNFHIINGDFETYDFGGRRFDLLYSAAAIQWVPEQIGFSRAFELLKPGGTFAMLLQRGDYRTPNEALYQAIQAVYREYFHPPRPYTCRLNYENVVRYGFPALEKREYRVVREFTASQYAAFTATHCDHIELPEPDRSRFFEGIKAAVLAHGNKLVSYETVVLYLTRKPTE